MENSDICAHIFGSSASSGGSYSVNGATKFNANVRLPVPLGSNISPYYLLQTQPVIAGINSQCALSPNNIPTLQQYRYDGLTIYNAVNDNQQYQMEIIFQYTDRRDNKHHVFFSNKVGYQRHVEIGRVLADTQIINIRVNTTNHGYLNVDSYQQSLYKTKDADVPFVVNGSNVNLLLIWKDAQGSVRVNRFGYTGVDSRMYPRYNLINALPTKHTLQGIVTFRNSKNITQSSIVDKLITQRNVMYDFNTVPSSPKALGYDIFTYHSGKLGTVPWTRASLSGWKVGYAFSMANMTNPSVTQFPSGYTVQAGTTHPLHNKS